MNILLLGPHGSGKGTQARKIAEAFGMPHISTGDMLREIARQDTDLGAHVDLLLRRGKVSDNIVIDILKERLLREDCRNGFVLNNYPRNLQQAKLLEQTTKIDAAIYLNLSEDMAIKRLASRLLCQKCGEIYGTAKKPVEDGKCDLCGGDLYQSGYESDFAVRRRLELFRQETKQLIDYYKNRRILHVVNASQSIGQVFNDISLILENL